MAKEYTLEEFERLDEIIKFPTKKEDFVNKYRDLILWWIRDNEKEIVDIILDKKYSWHGRSYEESIRKRNELEELIRASREKNSGGIDLETADEICIWGFGKGFPLRDTKEIIKITRKAFEYLDKGNYFKGIKTLLQIKYVGISIASKIIGLSNQKKLCIYDSRVGNALKSLKKGSKKLVLCRQDRSSKRDYNQTTKNGWARNYERLIWILEIMIEYFKKKSYEFGIANIEMALFMMGK